MDVNLFDPYPFGSFNLKGKDYLVSGRVNLGFAGDLGLGIPLFHAEVFDGIEVFP